MKNDRSKMPHSLKTRRNTSAAFLALAAMCFLASAQWCAAQAPTVDNDGGASNVTETSATLNGNLTSGGGTNTADVTIFWGPTGEGTNAVATSTGS